MRRELKDFVRAGLIALILIAVSYLLYQIFFNQQQTILPSSSSQPSNQPSPTNTPETIPFPAHGTVNIDPELDCLAPFTVTTPDDEKYYYIKLKHIDDKSRNVTIFLGANQTFKTTVPIGQYDFYYTCGTDWYGETELFGKSTLCTKAIEPLIFIQNETGIQGHIVTLIKQVDGNLRTQSVDESEIFD